MSQTQDAMPLKETKCPRCLKQSLYLDSLGGEDPYAVRCRTCRWEVFLGTAEARAVIDSAQSPAVTLLKHVMAHEGKGCGRSNSRRAAAFTNAIELAITAHIEFWPFDLTLGVHWWGSQGAQEGLYARACDLGHRSACVAFERMFRRPAFILKGEAKAGRRLAEGSGFMWEGEHVQVTSFGHAGEDYHLIACSYVTPVPPTRCEGCGRYAYPSGNKRVDRRHTITLAQLKEHNSVMLANQKGAVPPSHEATEGNDGADAEAEA